MKTKQYKKMMIVLKNIQKELWFARVMQNDKRQKEHQEAQERAKEREKPYINFCKQLPERYIEPNIWICFDDFAENFRNTKPVFLKQFLERWADEIGWGFKTQKRRVENAKNQPVCKLHFMMVKD